MNQGRSAPRPASAFFRRQLRAIVVPHDHDLLMCQSASMSCGTQDRRRVLVRMLVHCLNLFQSPREAEGMVGVVPSLERVRILSIVPRVLEPPDLPVPG